MDDQDKTLDPALDTPDTAVLRDASARTDLERLTLHEERASVQAVQALAGRVSIRKVITERQEVIPVNLTTEKLEIIVTDGAGLVTLNGEVLEPGRSYEVLVSDEKAVVTKQVYAISDITISKQTHAHTHTEEITLRREVLEVRDPRGLVREVNLSDVNLTDGQV